MAPRVSIRKQAFSCFWMMIEDRLTFTPSHPQTKAKTKKESLFGTSLPGKKSHIEVSDFIRQKGCPHAALSETVRLCYTVGHDRPHSSLHPALETDRERESPPPKCPWSPPWSSGSLLSESTALHSVSPCERVTSPGQAGLQRTEGVLWRTLSDKSPLGILSAFG